MFFIEDNNFASEQLKKDIDSLVFGANFAFYYNEKEINYEKEKSPYLTHSILKRYEERKQGELFNSVDYQIFLELLGAFCKKHNIEVNELLRISVNLTYNNGQPSSPTHLDHEFPHNQLLIYLNDPIDKNSKTVIYDDDRTTILKEVTPERYKGICFEKKPHALYHPTVGDRFTIIYTFR